MSDKDLLAGTYVLSLHLCYPKRAQKHGEVPPESFSLVSHYTSHDFIYVEAMERHW